MRSEYLDHRITQVARRTDCIKDYYQLASLSFRDPRGFLGGGIPDTSGSPLIRFDRLSPASPSYLSPCALFRARDLDLETAAMAVLCHSINVTSLRLHAKTVPVVADLG